MRSAYSVNILRLTNWLDNWINQFQSGKSYLCIIKNHEVDANSFQFCDSPTEGNIVIAAQPQAHV